MSSQPTPLAEAVAEIERHVATRGWDQPPRLYALAPTDDVVRRRPELAGRLAGSTLTPVEQEPTDLPLEQLLETLTWPETVSGCALALERIVLPSEAEEAIPDDAEEALTWAQRHPARTDVRIVVGVLRSGTQETVLRVRGHDEETDLISNAEVSRELADALAHTLAA